MSSIKKAYRDFLNTHEGANVYRQFKRLLYARNDSLVQWLNPSVFQTLPAVRGLKVRVCDIGGGDGDRITRILQFLQSRFGNRFHLDFIEQSALYVSEFDPAPLSQFCRTKVHHKLFEETELSAKSYHLVLLIHSIFAFENGNSTEKVLALRRDGGSIVVVSNASKSFLGGLKRLTDYGYEDRRFEIDDLERTLRKLQIPYQRRTTQTEWAIERKTWRQDMSVILDWISLGRFKSFPTSKCKEIESYIYKRGRERNSKTFFKEEEVVLVIPSVGRGH